jgi:hypothetical protein
MSLNSALQMAQHASFYVAPKGTIQHKVAWTWSKPGLLLSANPKTRKGVAQWHASKIEQNPDTYYLPPEYTLHPSNLDGIADGPWTIAEPKEAAKFALESFLNLK